MTEKEAVLPTEEATLFRSCVMRGAYLSNDRADMTESIKSLSSAMKNPKPGDMTRLKRLGLYLCGKPYAVRVLRRQSLSSGVKMSGNSDWAGDLAKRKSTGGLSAMFGQRLIGAKSKLQSAIAMSSMEAEYYAMTKTAAYGLFLSTS